MKKCTVICICNNKGGVGKTATAASLGYLLSKEHMCVLMVDSDPQGNLSSKFEIPPQERRENYIGMLIKNRIEGRKQSVIDFICHNDEYENLDIMVSDNRLDAIYGIMANTPVLGTIIFKNIVDEIKHLNRYDYIIIDTRPALRNEVGAALVASDYILVPILASDDSIMGANDILEFTANCMAMNERLKIAGIFFNRVHSRTSAYKEAFELVRENWKNLLMETVVPQNQAVVNAENHFSPVAKMFPSSPAARAFKRLKKELVTRIEEQKAYKS